MERRRSAGERGMEREGPTLRHTLTVLFLWAAGIGLTLYFFFKVTLVLLILLLAAAFAAALRPVSRRLPAPRWLSGSVVGVVFWLVIGAALAGLGWFLQERLQQLLGQWWRIRQSINEGLKQITGWLSLSHPLTLNQLTDQATAWLFGGNGSGLLAQLADSTGTALVGLVLVVFGTIYLLSERTEEISGTVARLLRPRHREPLRRALTQLDQLLRGWLLGLVISMTIVGTLTWLGFWIIDMRMAVPLAILAGMAEIVPTLGPVMAFLVALLVALPSGGSLILGVGIVYVIIQTVESYLIHPIVMKETVRIPPIITLFTVVLWGRIFGMLGLILAIPVNLVLWVLMDQFILQSRSRQPPDQ